MTQVITPSKEHVFSNMKEYMFSNENTQKWWVGACLPAEQKSAEQKSVTALLKKTQKQVMQNAPTKNMQSSNLDTIFPNKKDKLFWCFYIAYRGIFEYEFHKSDAFKVEKELKIKAIEILRSKKPLLKSLKLKLSVIESNLMNKPMISLESLQGLCLAFEVNVKYVWNRCYCDFFYGTNQPVLIKKNSQNSSNIGLTLEPTEKTMDAINADFYQIMTISKPLMAQSNYTLKQLQEMCRKLLIPIKNKQNKRYLRKELYEAIVAVIS